ncbi:MAG: acetate--CoA ligase family protein [Chloroflexi bacterium]|nr:acetate--CoA ligase family protein [Chloroflexota bacterium]
MVRDTALALAPVDRQLAAEMVAATRVGRLLEGYRGGQPADIEALLHLLVSLSQIALAYGDVLAAIDLNPVVVLAEGRGVRVLDALVVPVARPPLDQG